MPGPTTIQIKRSLNTGTTPSLANGELGFTANGDVLFIGSNAVTIAIAGKRVPGVLTANQSLITNSTNMIDTLMVGNSTINAVVNASSLKIANSTAGITLIKPDTTQIAGQYYLKADGSWSTVTAGSATPAGANTQVQYNDSGVTGAVAAFTFDEVANNVYISNSFLADLSARVGSATVNVVANSTVVRLANSTVTFDVNKPTAAQVSSTDYYLASDSTWKQITPPASSLDGLTDVTIASVANNQLLVYDNVAGQWENHDAGNGFSFAGQVPAILGGSTLTVNTLGVHVNSALSIQDLTLGGNLTVSGTLSTVDAVNLVVNDSIISLARNNGADTLDIGLYGQYNDGTERFTGLIWDTTDDTYYLFANTTTEPTTTLSIADANLRYSTLRTYLISNAFTSNATAVNITATASTSSVLTINTLSVSGVSTLAAQIANSTGFVPTSNTAGQNFGNAISRLVILANTVVTSGGASPDSNTLGTALGTTTQRWVLIANTVESTGLANLSALNVVNQTNTATLFVTTSANVGTAVLANSIGLTTTGFVNAVTVVNSASHTIGATMIANTLGVYHTGIVNAASHTTTGFLANATHVVPTSNSSGQTFGNTISRWVMTANSLTVSGGASPDSNTLGTALGSTTQRWVITANSVATQGQLANAFGVYPVSNTVGQLFGNTISRWEITANTLALSTALLGTSGGTGLASYTTQDILVANTTNGFSKLTLGGAGTVLQSFGGALIYDFLDGGTF